MLDAGLLQLGAHDVAFFVIVIGILLAMTGAFGDPNLVIVGIVVSLAGLIGVVVEPESTLLVLAALVPVVGFLLFYLYRHVQYPRSEAPEQTSSARSLVGQAGDVTEEVTPRGGEVELLRGGFTPTHRARSRSGTIAPGERVIVIEPGGGNVLTVAPADEVDVDELETPQEAADDVGWKVVDDILGLLGRNKP